MNHRHLAAHALAALALVGLFACAPPERVPSTFDPGAARWEAGPPTPSTCFWQIPGFGAFPLLGPERAEGLVLWTHGQKAYRKSSWLSSAPPFIKAQFAAKGWDVVQVQRNGRCEGRWRDYGKNYVNDFVQRVEKAKAVGYRHIIAAGQSMGATVSLAASQHTNDIEAIVAFGLSPGTRACQQPGRYLYHLIRQGERFFKSAIRHSNTMKTIITIAAGDHCIGHSYTPTIRKAFAKKPNTAFIYLDEHSGLIGHTAAISNLFNLKYGQCLRDFIAHNPVSPGRHDCTVDSSGELSHARPNVSGGAAAH